MFKSLIVRLFVVAVAVTTVVGGLLALDRRDEMTETVAKIKSSAVAITFLTPPPPGKGLGRIIGAGCVIDDRGYVLTCAHVTKDQQVCGILLSDGTELVGYVVFADEENDLAGLQIRRLGQHKLQEVSLVSSSDLILGERTIVIGSPMGLDHSVSFGRVSNLSRDLRIGSWLMKDLAQTDAAINPGNSGGPVFNSNGEYIGTVNAKINGSTGLGFFIKSDVTDRVLSEKLSIIAQQELTHGITAGVKVLKKEGRDRQQLVVSKVTGPAEKAGIQPNDIILKVVGREIHTKFDLERSLWDCQVNDKVTVTVVRGGEKMDLTLQIESCNAHPEAADPSNMP